MSKGIQPRLSAKVPKDRLSGKGCGLTKTTRMLAQRQPSFKKCVTAYWSSDSAPKMYGAISLPPKLWIQNLFWVVEERSLIG